MRVCMLSKFPPTEGGIASRSYWLARGLAQKGIDVRVITNANSVEHEYRIDDCSDHLSSMKGVAIYNLQEDIPWHIPFSKDYLTRLLSLTLSIVEAEEIELLDTGYLVPFGIAGWLASRITGLPYIVRHGGSDIGKFLSHKDYRDVLQRVVSEATAVVTDEMNIEVMKSISKHVIKQPPYIPSNEFAQVSRHTAKATFAYIGKVNFHWERKGLAKIVELFNEVPSELYELLFVAQGKGLNDLLASITSERRRTISFKSFVPPWKMPELLAGIDYIFDISEGDPIASESFLAKEAALSGVQVISNRLDDAVNIIRWPLSREEVLGLINKPRVEDTEHSSEVIDYDQWISKNIDLYEDLIGTGEGSQ
jgi:hypothetical protein